MTTTTRDDYILHVLRNPHGFDADKVREMRLAACDLIESQEKQIRDLLGATQPTEQAQPVAVSLGLRAVAVDLLQCFEAWEPTTRVMGNVRARDGADLMRAILAAPMPAAAEADESDEDSDVQFGYCTCVFPNSPAEIAANCCDQCGGYVTLPTTAQADGVRAELKRDALIMANARRLIRTPKRTSNAGLYMELFGTGFTTANARCEALGIDPDSNETSYTKMIAALEASPATAAKAE